MTALCALYMGALKIFDSPWVRPRLLFPQKIGKRERGRIQGLPNFWVLPIISGTGIATNFKFGRYIHRVRSVRTKTRTDRQTDDMQSQYRALHYNASRGKNDDNRYILAKVIVKIKKKLHLAYYIWTTVDFWRSIINSFTTNRPAYINHCNINTDLIATVYTSVDKNVSILTVHPPPSMSQ